MNLYIQGKENTNFKSLVIFLFVFLLVVVVVGFGFLTQGFSGTMEPVLELALVDQVGLELT